MKIGILTFHRSYNYGAFMQCFSLVKRLKHDFPNTEFEVIDYDTKKSVDIYSSYIERASEPMKAMLKTRNDRFLECQEQLPLSSMKIVSNDYSDAIKYMNENYDAVIVGSDAVWNWVTRGFPNIYFLKDYKGEKFSYAASVHGMIYQNMNNYEKEYLNEAFSDFTYIGARDITTENMVHFAIPEAKVYHNCDPTMFLDLDTVPCNLEKLKNKMIKSDVDFSKPIIGMMAGPLIGKQIKKKYGDTIELVAVYEPNEYADVYLYDLSPFEWAHVFSFFNVTLTHFFHGTMLSLVNKTPVIPVEFINGFSAVNTTKIKDLINRLDLNDWRFEANRANESIFLKAMRKFGLIDDKKMWNSIFEKIDYFINNDVSEQINNKVKKEASEYNTFYDSLSDYIATHKEDK